MTEVKNADALICCLETLCLGGMIPARRVSDGFDEALSKLALLKKLKGINPDLRILAFGVIVRVPHGNDPYEEKDYFATYGDQLRSYSITFDKWTRYQSNDHYEAMLTAKKTVPKDFFDDWLATRQRNHQLHLEALDYTESGIIEHLCLGLDDTTNYGLAALDRRALEAKTDDLALWKKVNIYPGADEIPCTLLARLLEPNESAVYVSYSSTLGFSAGMMFEDRPAGELIKAHLRAAACYQVDQLEKADWVLAVNVPAHKQPYETAQPDFAFVDTSSRHLPEFIDSLARLLESHKVAIADIAYPNGAELRFLKLLRQEIPLDALAGFAAWNTAGNTLGSCIAMAICSQHIVNQQLWIQLLFNRFVDDYLYQAWVRPKVHALLHEPNNWNLGPQLSQAEKQINQHIEPLARALWKEQFSNSAFELEWQSASLAWPRLFTAVFPFEIRNME